MTAPITKGYAAVDFTGTTLTSVSVDPTANKRAGSTISAGDWVVWVVVGASTAPSATPAGITNARSVDMSAWGTRASSVWVGTWGGGAISQTLPTSNGAQASIWWGSGHDATITDWILGTATKRSVSGTTCTAVGVTTVVNDCLVLVISMEATTTTEADITSITNATEWGFLPQTTTPQIHTTVVGTAVKSTAGAVSSSVVTYPNSSANGIAMMIAIPASAGNVGPTAEFTGARDGYTFQFTDASTDVDGSVVSWAWDFGDGSTSTAQSPSHAYAKHGTYTVTLVVTDDDGATGSVSHGVIVSGLIQRMVAGAPVEHDLYRMVAGSPVRMQKLFIQGAGALGHKLYDRMNRYANGTTPVVAETGQTWALYSGPAFVTDGWFDSVEGTGASYLYAPTTGEVTLLGMRFQFDTKGGTRSGNGSSVLLMVWDHIETLAHRGSRCHVALAPNGITISTFPVGGAIHQVASASLSPALSMDTEHLFEVALSGTTITVYVDGVSKLTGTDAAIADDSTMREAVFEPFYNNDGTDPRAKFKTVWADWS